MGKLKTSETYGIHTIELYAKNLKYTAVQKVIDRLADSGKIQKIKSDSYNIDRHLKSQYFVEDGIRMRIYQSYNHSSGIGFTINPCSLLSGKYQPVRLWKPTPEATDGLLKRLSFMLEMLGLDCVHVEDLSLSQMDLTANIWGVDPAPRIRKFRKGIIPRGFEAISNQDKEYLYMIKSKRAGSKKPGRVLVKAYDKIHELKINHRCPKSLKDKTILRLEVSMKREAFLKKMDLDRTASLYEMLRAGYDRGEEIIFHYRKKMYPFTGKSLRYEETKKLVQEKTKDDLLQEQMLFLLKKTSDSTGVSAAVQKLEDHYNHVDDRRVKKIFNKFDELGISPVTQPHR